MSKLSLTAVLLVASTALVMATGQTERATPDIRVNPPGTYPIVDDPVTIDVMTRYSASRSDGNLQGAAFTSWIEDLTNVRVIFDAVENNVWAERLNLTIASGELPDAIFGGGLGSQEVFQNGVNGSFIAVDELIDAWMPNYAARLKVVPEAASQLTMPNGRQYSIGSFGANYHVTMSLKMWVYMPWLEKLGLDVPETTEEFYQMLVAFKNDDPNDTGRADTIPMTGAAIGAWNAEPLSSYLMSSFIYTQAAGDAPFLKRTNGRVEFVANTDEWREGVRYMARLYREGLIEPDWFTQNRDQLRAKVENPGTALVGAVPAGWYGIFSLNNWDGSGRFADFHPIPPLRGPRGTRQTVYNPPAASHPGVITSGAAYPEVIARLLDWIYESQENFWISTWFRFPGEDYRYLTEEEKASGRYLTRQGEVASWVFTTTHTTGADRSWPGWDIAFSLGWTGEALNPAHADDPTKQEVRLARDTRSLYEPYRNDQYMPAGVIVAEELQDELADVKLTIAGGGGSPGLVQQFYAEFVTGARNIDSDTEWRSYVRELERAGVNRYVEIFQQTLTTAGY